MANAVNCLIDNEGGFAIVDGDFEDSLALPIAGLMTNEDSHEVAEKLEKLQKQLLISDANWILRL